MKEIKKKQKKKKKNPQFFFQNSQNGTKYYEEYLAEAMKDPSLFNYPNKKTIYHVKYSDYLNYFNQSNNHQKKN